MTEITGFLNFIGKSKSGKTQIIGLSVLGNDKLVYAYAPLTIVLPERRSRVSVEVTERDMKGRVVRFVKSIKVIQ